MRRATLWEMHARELFAESTAQSQPGPPNLPYETVANLPGKEHFSAKPYKTQEAPRRGILPCAGLFWCTISGETWA